MENEEFELVEDLGTDNSNEQDTSSTEIDVEEDTDNISSQKSKNESNFKALYKSNKEKEKELAKERAEKAEMARELEQWRNLNPEYVPTVSNKQDELEIKVFKLENPESKEHLETIKKTALEYNIPFDKAWKIVKAELPEKSKSIDDFDFKSEPIKVKKTLKEITPEQALKLPKDQLAKWQILHGYATE